MGAGAAGAGAVLAALGNETLNLDTELKNRKTPGLVLLGTGATAIVTGAILLVVDRKKAKKAAK